MVALKNSKDIGEALAAKHDEIEAATSLALENDGLTDENKTRIDALRAEAKQLQSDYDWRSGLEKEMDERQQRLEQPRNAIQPQLDDGNSAIPRDHELEGRGGFRDESEFWLAISKTAYPGQGLDNRLQSLMVNRSFELLNAAGSDEQSTISDPYGGFLIPHLILPRLLKVTPEVDPTVNLVMDIPMASPMVSIPARVDRNHYSATSTSASYTGGITVNFKSETQAAASSRLEFERVGLQAHTAMGLVYATEEVLQDSPQSMAAIIGDAFREQWGAKMFEYKIHGTGVGEPEGILNAPCLITAARAGTGLLGSDILDMRARVWGYNNAIWLASYSVMDELMSAEFGSGNHTLFAPGSTIPGWGTNPSLDKPDTLLGRPIIFTEQCKVLNAIGDIYCANWTQYLWGARQGEQTAESIHVRFAENERAFRITWRGDGRAWWRSNLVTRWDSGSAYTLSPFVALAVGS